MVVVVVAAAVACRSLVSCYVLPAFVCEGLHPNDKQVIALRAYFRKTSTSVLCNTIGDPVAGET